MFVWRETPDWIKRSRSTRLTCPLTSRCNKEERGGDSPAILPSTNPLCTMRVGSVQSAGITHRRFELWRQESTLPYPSAVSHQVDFWCWIDLLLVNAWQLWRYRMILSRVTYCAFSLYCPTLRLFYVHFSGAVAFLSSLHAMKWCWRGSVARLEACLFICRAPCKAHCLFRAEEDWLKPVAGSCGGLSAPYQVVWLKYKYCLIES